MEELEKKVLQEKFNGLSDLEIAKKYRVSLRFIEKVITKSSGVNISNLSKFNKLKKIRAFSPSHFKENGLHYGVLKIEVIGLPIVVNIEEIGPLIFQEISF